jgi:hypothetical protein
MQIAKDAVSPRRVVSFLQVEKDGHDVFAAHKRFADERFQSQHLISCNRFREYGLPHAVYRFSVRDSREDCSLKSTETVICACYILFGTEHVCRQSNCVQNRMKLLA